MNGFIPFLCYINKLFRLPEFSWQALSCAACHEIEILDPQKGISQLSITFPSCLFLVSDIGCAENKEKEEWGQHNSEGRGSEMAVAMASEQLAGSAVKNSRQSAKVASVAEWL